MTIDGDIRRTEKFAGARDLAKAAMNRAQGIADSNLREPSTREQARVWVAIAEGWALIADLYRERR